MKLYRLLLSFYPARFREEYAGPLQQQFRDDYRDAQTLGARLKLWLSALRDLAWSIPIELAHELKQDLSHSLRVHKRRPFVMTFTIAILALAIGGATGVFSVVNAVLIKSLPFRDPDRLVVLSDFMGDNSTPKFHKWRTSSAYLEDAAQAYTAEVNVTGASVPTRITIAQTSFNFFCALGTEPMLGRGFAPTEDIPGNDAVAVISHALWQQLFGGNPRVLGSKLMLNGEPFTIVGVARPGFDYPHKSSVWTPTIFDHTRLPYKGRGWDPFGRLKRGVSLAQARQMYQAEAAQWPRPVWMKNLPPPNMVPLRVELANNIREASLILMAAVGFILLIACANVANLLLTRTSERRNELIVRAALGASRARLVQQLMSESVLLSSIAAAAGLAVAYWASKLATLSQPAQLASQKYTILDWRVLAFAIGIAIFTGLLFGVVPALVVRHLQPSGDLARMHSSAPRTSRLRSILIAVQVALTLILLAGSVTMGRSFLRLLDHGMGFPTDHLIGVSVSLTGTGEQSEAQKAEYYREALDRLRAVPGVESASAAYTLPLDDGFGVGTITLDSGRESDPLLENRVTPDYFRTMDIPLLYGREFTSADTGRVVILSKGIASEIAEGSSVLGRKVVAWDKEPYTIIGVVRATRYFSPDSPVREQISLPVYQKPPDYATILARVHGNAADSLAACRDAVQSVDRNVPVFNAKTVDQRFDETVAVPRFRTTIFLFFGGFAMLLAVAGIYGVSSYSITQRRREIGVRIAIGASAQGVRAMILRQALWPIAAGMLIGLGGAAWQGRLLEHLLSSAPPVDLGACAASAALLAAVAIVSIWSATSRVLELNPIEVLKSE
jgi:putative ABC transport system permease protein